MDEYGAAKQPQWRAIEGDLSHGLMMSSDAHHKFITWHVPALLGDAQGIGFASCRSELLVSRRRRILSITSVEVRCQRVMLKTGTLQQDAADVRPTPIHN